MSDFILKVSTEALINQADSVRANVGNIRSSIDNIERIIRGSTAYWQGDASDLHLYKYTSRDSSIRNAVDRLGAYTDDLLQMAGVYDRSETENTQIANSLRTNIIT